jgi:hypothetical protein
MGVFVVRHVRGSTFRLIYTVFSTDGIGKVVVRTDGIVVREERRLFVTCVTSDGTAVRTDTSLTAF